MLGPREDRGAAAAAWPPLASVFSLSHALRPCSYFRLLFSTRRFKLKKVVGGGDALTAKGLTVKAHAFTASARAAIEGNGGTCVVLPKTAPAEAAPAAAE